MSFSTTSVHHSVFSWTKKGKTHQLSSFIEKHPSCVNDEVNQSGSTLLHIAAAEGHLDIVVMLLKHKAIVDAVNDDHQTPLHFASRWGRYDIVLLLLKHGAHVNAQSSQGNSPLHLACRWGRLNVSLALMKNGANTTLMNESGKTALELISNPASKHGLESALRDFCAATANHGCDSYQHDSNSPLKRAKVVHASIQQVSSSGSLPYELSHRYQQLQLVMSVARACHELEDLQPRYRALKDSDEDVASVVALKKRKAHLNEIITGNHDLANVRSLAQCRQFVEDLHNDIDRYFDHSKDHHHEQHDFFVLSTLRALKTLLRDPILAVK